jgi:osmotically-inducible protein OsmY
LKNFPNTAFLTTSEAGSEQNAPNLGISRLARTLQQYFQERDARDAVRRHSANWKYVNYMKETKMNIRLSIPAFIAAAMLGTSLVAPVVYAGETSGSSTQHPEGQVQAKIKDAWLHGKLEATLLFNEHLDSFAIDSDVRNGVAYLRGAVESDIDRDLAGQIAKSIDGITSVENELTVDKAKAAMAKTSDRSMENQGFKQTVLNATLTARIKSQLLLNGNTAGLDINVDSNDGVVTLSGEVDSEQEKELAVRIAENTNGSKSVNDRLLVNETESGE